jgi:hypothetical protein
MGWANCGYNEHIKKWMGYANEGVCAEEGCTTKIDHGLSYVCGSMHEGGIYGCGDYFCTAHLYALDDSFWGSVQLCAKCLEENERKDKEA